MANLASKAKPKTFTGLPNLVNGIDPQGNQGLADFNSRGTIAMFSCIAISTFARSTFGVSGVIDNGFRGDFADQELVEKLKPISRQKFEKMGKEPLVKEILFGSIKMPQDKIDERIDIHIKHMVGAK